MLAAKDGFQSGQTAKARCGPPCAVTPQRKDKAANYTLLGTRILLQAELNNQGKYLRIGFKITK
jgi:hypothetical protein